MDGNLTHAGLVPASLLEAMGPCAAGFRRDAAALADTMNRPTAEVVFGGHFSSGKSTLLNTLIGRPVLPTDDLPETGIPCRLAAGDVDEGRVITPDGEELPLEFGVEAIADVTSVYGPNGARTAAFPQRLDLRLANAPIPPDTAWLDSPGINDDPAMTAKAMATALAGDVLVWVLHSRQCLAEPEIRFLSDVVERRGATSIAFVVNVFLGDDTEQAWHTFLEREWPRHYDRIFDHLAEMGWGSGQPPIIAVSARAAQVHGGRGFGLEAFQAFLGAVAGPACPAVVNGRLSRLSLAVKGLISALKPLLRDAAVAEAALDHHRQRLESRQAFLDTARELVDEAVEGFGRHAAQASVAVAGQIGERLLRDDTYERMLNAELRGAGTGDFLCRAVDQALARHGWPLLSSAVRAELGDRGRAPAVSLTVADAPLDKGMVAAAAATGGAGGALLGPFALIGALGGAIVGLGAAKDDKARRDAAATCQGIAEAGALAARKLSARLSGVIGLLEGHIGELPPPPRSGGASLSQLHAVCNGYLAIEQKAQARLSAAA